MAPSRQPSAASVTRQNRVSPPDAYSLQRALRHTLAQRLAAPTLRELDALADTSSSLRQLWRRRRKLFERHVSGLTLGQLGLWGLCQLRDRLLFLRAPLTHTMFPIANMTFNNAVARDEDFTAEQPPGRAPGTFTLEPLALVTADHVLLDGMRVTRNGAGPKDQNWPTVVFVSGNGMTYEESLVPACLIAEEFRADVILGNYRGVGKSLGRLRSIEDAVADTAAFLTLACTLSTNVGLLGLSMGGGTGAAAVARLHQSGVLAEGELSLFLAVHTFSCWFDVARARSGLLWALSFFGLARLMGMRDLETCAYLQRHPLAQHTFVAEASMDRVLPASARLGAQPLPPHRAQVFWHAGVRHGDLTFLSTDGTLLTPNPSPSLRAQLHQWRASLDAPAGRPCAADAL